MSSEGNGFTTCVKSYDDGDGGGGGVTRVRRDAAAEVDPDAALGRDED
jgi:hypothetical protein